MIPPSRARRWWLAAAVLLVAVLAAALRARPDPPARRWAAIEAAIQARRWPEAEARLIPWLERSPDDGQARLRLGGVLAFEGRHAEAVDALGRIGPTDPAWLPAETMLGESWLQLHELTRAERAFAPPPRAARRPSTRGAGSSTSSPSPSVATRRGRSSGTSTD